MVSEINIKPFGPEDLEKAKVFTDKWIGENYYTPDDLKNLLELGIYNDQNASFIANKIIEKKLSQSLTKLLIYDI